MSGTPPETLKLPSGALTRVRESDAADLATAAKASLDHLLPWMPWASRSAVTLKAQRKHCREAEQLWDLGSDYQYALRLDPAGPVIGGFGLHRRRGPGAIEIGYWVHVGHTGHGYGTAGADALTRAALALPGVDRVEILTDEANTISAAIPRRLGYRLDRIEPCRFETPSSTGRLQVWVMTRS